MAWFAPTCTNCDRPAEFSGIERMPEVSPDTLGVAYRCGGCENTMLDMFSLPPIEPRAGACVGCNAPLDGVKCTGCGVSDEWLESRIAEVMIGQVSLREEVQAMLSQGFYRLALDMLGRRLREAPDDAEAWASKADVLWVLSVYEQAEQAYRRALAGLPEDVEVHLHLAGALNEQGRFAEALPLIEAGLSLSEAASDLRCLLLVLKLQTLCGLRQPKDAESAADAALEEFPADPHILYEKGRAYGLMGRLQDGRDVLRSVIAIAPGNGPAMRALDQFEAALAETSSPQTVGRAWWKPWTWGSGNDD